MRATLKRYRRGIFILALLVLAALASLRWTRARVRRTPPAPPRSSTELAHFASLDDDLARSYLDLGLPRPRRVYGQELSGGQATRFAALRRGRGVYLASNLFDSALVLPDIIASLLHLALFLRPERLWVSIVSGPSSDGTEIILEEVLLPFLVKIGVPLPQIRLRLLAEGEIDWAKGRMETLAELRNMAMDPFWNARSDATWDSIVFFNDVYFNHAHVLELLHRKRLNHAEMTCAWDELYHAPTWLRSGSTSDYYVRLKPPLWNLRVDTDRNDWAQDAWVGRTLNGETFFPVGPSRRYWKPSRLFDRRSSPDQIEKRAHSSSNPFQVFSCWNGIVAFDPSPFLVATPGQLRFRSANADEANHSEALLIARDLWKMGRGRIMVVPGVRLGYVREMAELLREKEAASELGTGDGQERVVWRDRPPERIMAYPWPSTPGRSGNPWLNGRWVDALIG